MPLLANHFATSVDAAVDLHVNQHKSRVFDALEIGHNDPEKWSRAWKAIGTSTTNRLSSLLEELKNMGWEILYTIKDVPNYLTSLLNIIKQLLNNPDQKIIGTLTRGFVGAAKQLWGFLTQLVSRFSPFLASFLPEFDALLNAIKQIGTSFANSAKYLFRAVGTVVSAVINVYDRAVISLSVFSSDFVNSVLLVPAMGAHVIQDMHEKGIQIVVFSMICMQNLFAFADKTSTKVAQYVQDYAAQVLSTNNSLRNIMDSLDMSGAIKTAMVSLLNTNAVKTLLDYIDSSRIVYVIQEILAFVNRIVSNISSTVATYLTRFLQQNTPKFVEIIMQLINPTILGEQRDLTQACANLANDPRVSVENSERLRRVVRTAERVQKTLTDRDVMTFSQSWDAAHLVTNLYFDKQVSEDDVDEVLVNQIGMTNQELMDLVITSSELMETQLSVTFAQMRLDGKTEKIGTEVDYSLEIPEIVETLQRNRNRIEELKNLIIKKKNDFYRYDQEKVDEKQELLMFKNKPVSTAYKIDIDKMRKSIDDDYGITTLEKELDELQKQNKELDLRLQQKKHRVNRGRRWLGPLIFIVSIGALALLFVWRTRSQFEELQHKVFDDLLLESNYNQLLSKQIDYFVTNRPWGKTLSINDSPVVMDEFRQSFDILANDMTQNRLPLEQVQEWGTLLVDSAKMQQDDVQNNDSSWYSYLSRLPPLFSGGQPEDALLGINPPATGMEVTIVEKTVSINDVSSIAQGWAAMEGTTPKLKQGNYIMHVANLIRKQASHFDAFISTKKTRMVQIEQLRKGFAGQFFNWISKQVRGTGGTGADRSAGVEDVLEGVASGQTPFVAQQYEYWMTIGVGVTSLTHAAYILSTELAAGIMYSTGGDETIAGQRYVKLQTELLRIFGYMGADIVQRSVSIATWRLWLPGIAFKLIILFLKSSNIVAFFGTIGKGALNVVTWPARKLWAYTTSDRTRVAEGSQVVERELTIQEQKLLRRQKRRQGKLAQPIPCVMCNIATSLWATKAQPHQFYCSVGCAFVHGL